MSNLYSTQQRFFQKSYIKGEHGWPTIEPTKELVDLVKFVRARFKSGKPAAIDIGCGSGRHSILLAKSGFVTYAVDYVAEAIKEAKYYAALNKAKGIKFVRGDFSKMKFSPIFNLAIDYGVFHHILEKDRSIYLKRIYEVLKQDGFFIISCFSLETRRYFELKIKQSWRVHEGHYDKFYSAKELLTVLQEHFKVIKFIHSKDDDRMFHVLCRRA
ncbi:MAG: methyltransferase domain-containing protein [Planctomycetes bacterium]|nr:methyltransferase domain-containing protein [Planctomycetota bacterium]